MSKCTFIGHRDCPASIKPKLRAVLEDLRENYNVTMFFVGKEGNFDALVRETLRELKKTYPQIEYAVVFAYKPRQRDFYAYDVSEILYPEKLKGNNSRSAIPVRNLWMIENVNYVVTYVVRQEGNAAGFAFTAENMGKTVIPL